MSNLEYSEICYKVTPLLSIIVVAYVLKPSEKIKHKFDSFDRNIKLREDFRSITAKLNVAKGVERLDAFREYVRFYENIQVIINIKMFDKGVVGYLIEDLAKVFNRGDIADIWIHLEGEFPNEARIKYQRIIECYTGFWFKRTFFRFLWTLEDSFRFRTICSKIIKLPCKFCRKN